jgi:arylformamidase
MSSRYIDLSYNLEESTPVYPDYPPFRTRILETAGNDPSSNGTLNSSGIELGLHCGTHMDSPFHFFNNGHTIEQISLSQCIGLTLLINLSTLLPNGAIEKKDLDNHEHSLRSLRKVVLWTGWSRHWGDKTYFEQHPVLTGEAAQYLVRCGVHLLGVDLPSVDRSPFEAHLELLGHNVVILENLTCLDMIPSDVFQLMAIPLKLSGREASPVRAIAMEVN